VKSILLTMPDNYEEEGNEEMEERRK